MKDRGDSKSWLDARDWLVWKELQIMQQKALEENFRDGSYFKSNGDESQKI